MSVSERFAYRIPDFFSDMEAVPLLCEGAIGYRSLHLTHLAIIDTTPAWKPVVEAMRNLAEANQALVELKERKIRGAKVLVMDG